MSDLLNDIQTLVVGLLSTLWDVGVLITVFCWDILYHLHMSAPRLEGLLVGVVLAWVLLRRDKHPLLRVVSAPLRLVLSVLDLAWEQVVEIVSDLWGVAVDWVKRPITWTLDRVKGCYDWVMSKLAGLKDRLTKKSE